MADRLVAQDSAPADRAVGHLSAVERRPSRVPARSTRKTGCLAVQSAAGSTWKRCATRCWPSPAGSTRRCAAARWTSSAIRKCGRRTVYGLVDRQSLPGFHRAFDFASPDQSAERRPRTTVPQQALFSMNAPFVLEQAGARWPIVGRSPAGCHRPTASRAFIESSSPVDPRKPKPTWPSASSTRPRLTPRAPPQKEKTPLPASTRGPNTPRCCS